MPRDRAIIFRDLLGKLDVLNVGCEKCGRRGAIPAWPVDRAVRDRREAVRLGARGRLSAQGGEERARPVRREVSGSVEGGVRTGTAGAY
jgi:hypothetical protein